MHVKGVVVVEDPALRPGTLRPRCPEALEHVANQPIIYHVLDLLESAGIEEVIVASSSDAADGVRACLETRRKQGSARLCYVYKRGALDLAGGLALAAPLVGEAACIVHLASGLLDEPIAILLELLREDSPDAALVVHQAPTPEKHLNPATLKMLHIAEFDPRRAGLAMAGVWALGPGALSQLGSVPLRTEGDIDVTAVAERLTLAGGTLHVRVADSWCRYAGESRDLLELNRIALDGLQAEPRRPDNHGNTIEGRVWIHQQADVRSSVIVGPAMIGPEARIRDAYIGPYTTVGARARIEGSEIERSIISPGASIMHLGGRIVASVVGRDARVFRDFSLPRALRLTVGEGTEVALC